MSWTNPPSPAVGAVATSTMLDIYAADLTLIWGASWTPYAVAWGIGAGGTLPVIGNGKLFGFYKQIGKLCVLHVYLEFGSTTNGGAGSWTFSLPFNPALNVEQTLQCRGYCGGATTVGTYGGVVVIGAGNTVCVPYLPNAAGNCVLSAVQNANNAATPGTGIPAAASYPFVYSGTPPSSNLTITGTYETT